MNREDEFRAGLPVDDFYDPDTRLERSYLSTLGFERATWPTFWIG